MNKRIIKTAFWLSLPVCLCFIFQPAEEPKSSYTKDFALNNKSDTSFSLANWRDPYANSYNTFAADYFFYSKKVKH